MTQEFLAFPQTIPKLPNLGEICLLGEDVLDPYTEFMVVFCQDEEKYETIGDMLRWILKYFSHNKAY